MALADAGARNEAKWAELLFWVGLLVLFTPIAARLFSPWASRRERIGLVAMLGVGLYLVKLMYSPYSFTFYDELLHWRTASDIVQSGHLFRENLLLPVSPLYPGMEIVTNALCSLAGLSIFSAGVVVIGAARLVLILALYLFYEEVSHSPRMAGIALLLYMTNPDFVFFDAMFAYESLALPLAVLLLFAVARRVARYGSDIGLSLAIVLGLGAVVVTHHLTSYALVIFLALWTVVPVLYSVPKETILWYANEGATRRQACYCNERPTSLWRNLVGETGGERKRGPGGIALLSMVASLAWLVCVANLTTGYMASTLGGPVREFVRLITGEVSARQIFSSSAGTAAPLWERLMGYTAVVFLLVCLPWGLFQIRQRYRANAVALALAVGTLAYPVSLGLRFTHASWQISNRLSEFLFVAVAFVLAVGVAEFRAPRRPAWGWPWGWHVVFAAWATIIFLGGVIAAWPSWARLPGPYLAAADTRSIEPQGVAAAEWARDYPEPDSLIAADRINRLLMGSYGGQRPVAGSSNRMSVVQLYFSSEMGPAEQGIIQRVGIRYILVDRRLSRLLPKLGYYFETAEPAAYQRTTAMDPAALAKFDGVEDVSRVFDSGDIQIYDVGALGGGP